MFTLNFCGQEWIFPRVVNLVHESMFSMFVFMRVQKSLDFIKNEMPMKKFDFLMLL